MFIVAIFAGCVGSEAGTLSESPGLGGGQPAGPAEFDDTTGAIEGTVTDSELIPIPGAQVGLLKSDIITTDMIAVSDAGGKFTISRIPPGEHTLSAQALGYESTGKRVTIVAGQPLVITLALESLAVETAYMNTVFSKVQLSGVMWKLTPQCMYFSNSIPVHTQYNSLAKTCGGVQTTFPGSPSCTYCQTHTATDKRFKTFTSNWTTIIAEMTWKPQTGVSGRGFLFDLNAPNVTRGNGGSIDQASPYTWYKSTSKPPIAFRVDKPTTLVERKIPESDWNNYEGNTGCTAPTTSGNPNCNWFWRVFPAYCDLNTCDSGPDYGVMADGVGDIYFSYFIRDAAPTSWSALPDN